MKGCDTPPAPPPPPPPPPPPLRVAPEAEEPGAIVCSDHVCQSPEHLGREAYHNFLNHPNTIAKYLEGQCYLSLYRPVQPMIQKGPLCGMVALAMAAHLLSKQDVSAESILEKSKSKKYSHQGELFSADWVIHLARDMLRCDAEQLAMTEGRGAVVWKMLRGSLLLVPYDADKNHYPCLKKGHKAHWALITGFFVVLDKALEKTLKDYLPPDPEVPNLYHCKDPRQLVVVQHQIVKSCKIVHVYGHQGKSKYPGIWPLDDLLASNANLREIDPERVKDIQDYVVPGGGIRAGLCGRIVTVTAKK
ncbi:actin maturation protease-like [Haliotis cracherodii]|uniref:actin maturation protease-like n=1 Tax=Haliotis cracherodii TaxID=6455 RepID=UPI0039E9B66F